ncbi:MAG: NAD-dependent epimerase/dehydratase family protein [Treponema sp.]|nr:NAD-dependent epimerase/dehydratase family protein [Treponema sp.]
MRILLTGAAGFIGYHAVLKLASLGYIITGIDNINEYYDVNLKYARLLNCGIKKNKISYNKKTNSTTLPGYSFIKLDLTDKKNISKLFLKEKFDIVINLAAQAGVRYSIENPHTYIESNINGFINILESCRQNNIKKLIFASSSSVYGEQEKAPFSVLDNTDKPISLYAATKKSNEVMAYTYSHLFGISCTGLRFFTVYGSYGRPDMAYYKFANAILNNKPIQVYNNGDMLRDFTYIDDIIEGLIAAVNNSGKHQYALYNLGNNKPEKLTDFIETLEKNLECKAQKVYLGMQPGDVPVTAADIELTKKELNWQPKTSMDQGLKEFCSWFKSYSK